MTKNKNTLKKGTLLIVETGEYSDFQWHGPVRLLKNTTEAQLFRDFKKAWKRTNPDKARLDEDDFLPWLIRSKRAEDPGVVHSLDIGYMIDDDTAQQSARKAEQEQEIAAKKGLLIQAKGKRFSRYFWFPPNTARHLAIKHVEWVCVGAALSVIDDWQTVKSLLNNAERVSPGSLRQ